MKHSRHAENGGSSDRGSYVVVVGLALAVFLTLSISAALFNDGDTSWHLAAGRYMLQTRSVPDTDPFSFTAAGRPWVAHEWLSEVLMAWAFAAGGWSAVSLMFAAAIGALVLIVGLEAQRWLAPVPLTALLAALIVGIAPYALARPHVLTWPILAGWIVILLRSREQNRAPPLIAALLMTVWANLHGSFAIGILLAGVFALEALRGSENRRATFGSWAAFGAACVAAGAVTPHGIRGLVFPFQLMAMKSLSLIAEWRPTRLVENPSFAIILIAGAGAIYRGRAKLPPLRLLLIIGLTYLAFQHVRHQAVLVIVTSLLLAEPLARASRRVEKPRSAMPPRPITASLLGLVLAVCVVRPLLPSPRADSPSNPLTALKRMPQALRTLPVLNDYSFGGPLILNGVRPFIDGRADMYGDAFLFEHQKITQGDLAAFKTVVKRFGIRWTVLAPTSPLATRLDTLPGWHRIYADRFAVIHVEEK